jgi:uncharacterized membrane protein
MTFGAAIFMIAAGAIIRYALHLHIGAVDEHTIGTILIILGIIGLIVAGFQELMTAVRARRAGGTRYSQ